MKMIVRPDFVNVLFRPKQISPDSKKIVVFKPTLKSFAYKSTAFLLLYVISLQAIVLTSPVSVYSQNGSHNSRWSVSDSAAKLFDFGYSKLSASAGTIIKEIKTSTGNGIYRLFSAGTGNNPVSPEPAPNQTASSNQSATTAALNSIAIFGPKRFDRTRGAPNQYQETFSMPAHCAFGTFQFIVRDGEPDGSNRNSSATIKLNGTEIFTQSDFNQNVYQLAKSVALQPVNTIDVKLQAAPGSYITIEVIGQRCDDAPPTITITSPPDNTATTAQTINLTGTAEDAGIDASGIAGVWVNDVPAVYNPADNTWFFENFALAIGPNLINARTVDNVGYEASTQITVIRDLTNPTVRITEPSDGMITEAANLTVNGTANDNGMDASQINRVTVNGADAVYDPVSTQWTIENFSLNVGSNTITAIAYDNAGNQASDEIIVTRVVNQPPTANAGTDQIIELPNNVLLSGTATDDGYPIGSSLSYSWSKVSGDGGVTFTNPNNLQTTANFSTNGIYILRLSVTDGQYTATDDVQITVYPENQAPAVNAGADQTVYLPNTANLSGTASDDGFPVGSNLTVSWSKVSGNGDITFENSSSLSTTASFSTAGIYVLRLTATDGSLSSADELTVTVIDPNTPPTVFAGEDISAAANVAVNLNGVATDDGLPAGSSLTILWTKISGPGNVSFADQTAAVTTAVFDQPGVYVLKLSADDGELSANDELNITVSQGPIAAFTVPGISRNTAIWENSVSSYFRGTDIIEFSSQFSTSSSYLAGNIIDDGPSTRWLSASGQITNQFITLGFPHSGIKTFDRIRLQNSPNSDAVRDFSVQISTTTTDAEAWTTVLTDTALQNTRIQEFILNSSIEAKYVRLILLNNYGSSTGISIYGFETNDINLGGIPSYFEYPVNAAQNVEGGKIISSSGESGSTVTAANTIDGSANSYWQTATGQINNQNFVVRLSRGKIYPVDRVRIYNYNGTQGVQTFKVEVSATNLDNESFTEVLSGTLERNSLLQEFVFPNGTINAKYLRFTALNNYGNVSNTRVSEFQAIPVRSSLTSFSSYSTQTTRPENLLDDDGSTVWLTAQGAITDQWVKIKLPHKDGELIESVSIQPHTSAITDALKDFEVFVSTTTDADSAFVPIVGGTILNNAQKQTFVFPDGAIRARYIKLLAKNNYGSANYIRVGTFEVTAAGSEGNIISNLTSPAVNKFTSPSLLANGATVAASSGSYNNNNSYTPNNILDYVSGNSWFTKGILNQFLKIDLAGDNSQILRGVRLGRIDSTGIETIRDFEIWISDTTADDAAFSRVFEGTVVNNRNLQTFYFSGTAAKYVKLIPKNNYGGSAYIALTDFDVITVDAGFVVESTSQSNQSYRPEYAFDSNSSSMWRTLLNSVTNQSVKLALPGNQPTKIYGVSIEPEITYSPKNFEIKVSTTTADDNAFSTVYSGLITQTNDAQTFLFDNLTDAKYVKVVFINGYHSSYISVREIGILTIPADGAALMDYSSRSSLTYSPENALDYNTLAGSWRTATGQNSNQFLKLALPGNDGWVIDHIALQPTTSTTEAPRHFELLVSDTNYSDASFQTVLKETVRNDGTLQHYFFNPVKAKYAKLLIRDNYGATFISLNAFWIFSPQIGTFRSRFLNRSTSSGSSLNYLWEFGDGATSNERDPLHQYSNPGLYNVRLTATDGNSLSNTYIMPYLVQGTAEVDFSWTPVPVKEGQSATFSDISTRSNEIREWAWGDNTAGTTVHQVQTSHTFADNGVYDVSMRAADDRGIYAQKNKSVEVINQSPTVNAGTDTNIYVGQNWTSASSVSDPGAIDRASLLCVWDYGDSQTSGQITNCTTATSRLSHNYAAAGSYTATLTVTDKDGASASDTVVVNVNKTPTLITYIGDESAAPRQPLVLKARLVTTAGFQPLSGKTIEFTFEGNTYTAVTNLQGEAETTASFNGSEQTQITARFNGDENYLASSTGTCGFQRQPIDAIVVIDQSGSMTGQKIIDAKNGANIFIDSLRFDRDQAGVVSFNDSGILKHQLSNDSTSLKTAVNSIAAAGGTNIGAGIDKARIELTGTRRNPYSYPVMLVLSDGISSGDPVGVAQVAKNAGIRVISIGLAGANEQQMINIASSPGDYYYTPDSTSLAAIYATLIGTLCRSANRAPVVNAGENQTITLPENSVSLNGTANDDGLPFNTLTVSWSKQEGPDDVTFSDPNSLNTTATFNAPGEYLLRLTAADGQYTTSSDLTVNVSSPNSAPQVNAGADQTVTLPNNVNLNGIVTDDGLPDGSNVAVAWSKSSGAGTVNFSSPNTVSTAASFSQPGTYVLRLTATDSQLTAFDELTVTVSGPTVINQPPVANAGEDKTVNLPGTLNLSGTVTDDGLPNSSLTIIWTKISGAGNVGFSNASSASTSVTFTSAGIYILRLTASDGQFSVYDDIIINVNLSPGNEPPPFNYRSFNNSPWNNYQGDWFYLENFEDHSLNTPGVSALTGGLVSILFGPSAHDSVDGDDGVLDGSGLAGDNFFNLNGAEGIKFVFNRQVLGNYPTHVAAVYTDGAGQTFYEAFDAGGVSLGVRGPFTFPVTSHYGEAINDFFLASYNPGGISAIRIWNTSGGIEVDHLQYGYQSNPVNMPPAVNAGPDRTITLTANTITLSGTVSDDGLPIGNTLQANWTFVSGSGNVTFTDQNSPVTNVTFSSPGNYVLRLTASDGELSSSDDVFITVNPAQSNQPPTVDAGSDSTIKLSGNLAANGSAEADLAGGAIPNWNAVSGSSWTRLQGGAGTTPFARFGDYVFSPGTAGNAKLIQDIDVRAFSEKINAGTQDFTLQVYLRSLSETTPDAGRVLVEYRNQTNLNTIATLNTGEISSVTDWHLTEDVRVPPVGTGFIRIHLIATRNTGLSNDVFFDGISFKAGGGGAAVKLDGTATDDNLPAGNSLQSNWSKVSGTGNVIFSNANSATSSVFFDTAGSYVLRLTANDGEFTSTDDVTLIVGAANQPPVANAGADATVNTFANLTLNGSASDDGTALRYRWVKVSGPGNVSINDARIASPTVSFSSAGTYILRLIVEDGEFEASDDVTVTVNAAPANQPPAVDAGQNQNIAFPNNTATLNGTATDDGLPNNNLTINWSKTSGAGNVTFADPNSAQTTAVFDAVGTYVLRLTVSDGQYTAYDEMAVTVSPENLPPTVSAGEDQTIIISQTAVLQGEASDDGLPAGGSFSSQWTKVSGDGNVTFSNPNQTGTYATFSQTGTYVLRLTVSDSQLSASDDVTVTVIENIPPPTAEITITDGASITEPIAVTGTISEGSWRLEYSLTDTDNPNNRVWTNVSSGTGAASGNLGTLDTTLMMNGLYDVRVITTDTYGRTVSDTVSVSVENNLKVGHFTVSFEDMNVPVAGIPMQVVRTYDSRDKRKGDFGIGWTLGIKNVRVEKNNILGLKWYQTTNGAAFPTYCVEATRPHIITVTMPDGEVEKFEAKLERECQQFAPLSDGRIKFVPQAGTRGTLSISGDNSVLIAGSVPGPVELYAYDSSGIFDRAQFKYTAKDGTEFVINQGGGLQSVKDADGNTLTISAGGITHSSGAGISFTRDAQGRITRITDPNGAFNNYTYDANGDLVSYGDRAGNTTSFTYETQLAHHLKSIVDPLGRTPIRNDYDASGRLLKHTDSSGSEIVYTHDLAARLETVTDRLGNATVYQYDARGNVLVKRDALGNETRYSYDANDNVLTETNALGKTTTYTYDQFDNRTSVTDALGNRTEMTYNSKGLVLTVKDAKNNVTTNTYNSGNNLLTTTDALGNVTTNTYSSQTGKLTSTRDALNNITAYEYTGNYLTKETDAQGNITTFGYDANGNRKSQTVRRTNAAGQTETITTNFEFDNLNRLTKTTLPDGTFTRTEYNELGQQTATFDQAGNRTEFQHDALGRLTKTTYADGTFEESTFDAEGRRLTSKDRLGRITAYDYDALGRLKKTTYSDGTFTQTNYDAAGQVTSSTDARGNSTFYTYDDAGRRLTVKNALDQITAFAYDTNGNQSSMTDALGHTTDFIYDALNRKTRTNFADNSFVETTFDELGRRIAEKDQAGKITQFFYDSLGRLSKVKDALDQETRYEYNELGQQTKQIDALGRETKYEYDRLGRRTKRILPLGQTETYAYATDGNLQSKTDFNGKTTVFAYDSMRRLLSKTPDASLNQPAVSYSYNALGLRQTMNDASGTTNYLYDSRNRLQHKATPFGTLSYGYDENSNIKTVRSSNQNGVSVDYNYDELSRLKQVKDNRLAGSQNTTYTYDAVGNLQSYTYPNQVTTSYGYNNLNRLTAMTVANASNGLASYSYTLGAAGNRTQVVEGNGRTLNYVYDDLYRLTSETIANSSNNGQIVYQYDAVGNRLQRTSSVNQVTNQSSTFDNNDRINSDTFDDNGNTKVSSGRQFNYDFENKLTSTSDGITIVYDGDGNRVSKTVGGVTTNYLVDTNNLTGYAQVVEELQNNQVVKAYIYGHDLISQRQSSGISFYNYDGHGSVRNLSNSAGQITDTYDYDAFGNLIGRTGTTDNNYLYAGEQFDADLGFYYNRARYLNVGTGRFISQDSYEGSRFEPITLHKYLYANADGVNRIDPSGYISSIDIQIAWAASVRILVGISTTLLTALQRSGGVINTTIRGLTFIQQIATSTFARAGNYLLVYEEKLANSNFRVDLIIQRVRGNEAANILVEGKGIPWNIINNPSAWSNYLNQLTNQAQAFSNSTQTVSGVTFTQRIIVFSTRPPAPQLAEIQMAIGRHYNHVFWSVQEYIQWLER